MITQHLGAKRIRMLEDFVLPSLNSRRFGKQLQWINKPVGTFQLGWTHKNKSHWTTNDTIVFQEWDKLKGHHKPEMPTYFMCSKQRFRAALYKLAPYCKLLGADKEYRYYRLIGFGAKKKTEISIRNRSKVTKRVHQRSIPTSVICENKSYVRKSSAASANRQVVVPPAAMELTPEEQKILVQYAHSQEKHNRIKSTRNYGIVLLEEERLKNFLDAPEVLRENSATIKSSHVAAQPAPIYCYSTVKCYFGHNQSPQEFPEVFVSKTYHEPENTPQNGCNDSEMYSDVEEAHIGVLNLSLKPSVNDTLSR